MSNLSEKEILVRNRFIEDGWHSNKSEPSKISYIYNDYRYVLEFRSGDVILHEKGNEHLLLKLNLERLTVESIVGTFEQIHDKFCDIIFN